MSVEEEHPTQPVNAAVDVEMERLTDEFVAGLVSPRTRANYASALRSWCVRLDDQNQDVVGAGRELSGEP